MHKTNYISCLTTTETSESAEKARRASWGKAVPGWLHEHWAPGDHLYLL